MSGLAGLLAPHVEPGIYRWHGHFPVEDVKHTVEHAGWRFAVIDGWHGPTKAEFLAEVGQALDFPDYYGQNFDALADCLGDVTAGDSEGWVLLWEGCGAPRVRRAPGRREDRLVDEREPVPLRDLPADPSRDPRRRAHAHRRP